MHCLCALARAAGAEVPDPPVEWIGDVMTFAVAQQEEIEDELQRAEQERQKQF